MLDMDFNNLRVDSSHIEAHESSIVFTQAFKNVTLSSTILINLNEL